MNKTKAVLLAGGQGSRLRPYTRIIPKPLVPLGDEPVLGALLRNLRRHGIQDAYIMLGHLGDLIRALLGDGGRYGTRLQYVEEESPLGTIGPLSLLRGNLNHTFLVANGDLVVDLDFQAMVAFHRSHGGLATVACHPRTISIEFGVVECDSQGTMLEFVEKPSKEVLVNMGVYVFEPEILDHVPSGRPFGADDLLQALLRQGQPVRVFRHEGYWTDIGRVEDLARAQERMEQSPVVPIEPPPPRVAAATGTSHSFANRVLRYPGFVQR